MKMYKLFVTRVTKRISPHGVCFIPKQVIVQHSMRLCSFCNFYHRKISKFVNHHQVRNSTTTANILNHTLIKKKVKQREKKYTELLTVTNESCTEGAEIQKLTASNLSALVDHPEVTKDDLLYNAEDHIFKASNFNIDEDDHYPRISEICDIQESNFDSLVEDEVKYHDKFCDTKINEENFVDANLKDSIIQNKKPKKEIDKKFNTLGNNMLPQKNKEFHKNKGKYVVENYIESLLAYIEVYLSCGLMNRANNTLMGYRKYAKDNLKCKKSIQIYNMVLEAYASKGKVAKVLELYDIIKKDLLIPTPQTYAYLFDAFGREKIRSSNVTEILEKLKNEMESYNISFNDIFNNSYFKNDQQENVLRTIKMLLPNFVPSYTTLNIKSKCNLLNELGKQNSYQSPVKELLTMEELKSFLKTQLQNETAIEIEIPSIEVRDKGVKISNSSEQVAEIENYWKDAALAAFEKNLKFLKQKECQSRNNFMVLYPFLEVLNKEHYVNAILREIKLLAASSETYSSSLKLLYIALGRYIYNKYEIETKKQTGVLDKRVAIYSKYLEWYLYPKTLTHLSHENNRIVWQYLEHEEVKHGTSVNTRCLSWPLEVVIKIGQFLYNIILNDIILKPEILKGHDLKCSIPAFYTLFRNRGPILSEQIKPHPFVSKLYKEAHLKTIRFSSLVLPSYSPPTPWTSIYSGGYLVMKTDFIRIQDYNKHPWYLLKNTPSEQLFPVFDSLNQLGSIPWRINTEILDIVIKIFQRGGSVELNVPQSISILTPPPPLKKNATNEEKQKAAIAMARYKQKKCEAYSLWCDALYKLSIADHFRDKIFWLPHNLDFRGRVYPIPPHLNHLSSDLSRSLLLFAKGKPLGPNGLEWLKLHVINLTNFKKGCSVKERLKFANENMDNILDSADKPLTGKMWWAKSEEPWQTLAGCMEIAKALKAPKVEEYISKYPVHQDGSCNGLQHYAALGRDQIGAESVNLYPFDNPKDVYNAVAAIVEKKRQMDAENNHKIAQVLEGFVKRKVIKQTVMTTVYGVTKYGAKHQIAKQLQDTVNFPEEYIWSASLYLTESTFHSLRTMFKSAREIQDWFTECARIISSVCGENVEWVTPLGLPIVQPYIKHRKFGKNVKGNEKTDAMKQRNAFAPNFVHSLDSTHMMLTSLNCSQQNVTFVSVHDCFWTHPCTVDSMNKICREQFVALHSEPILENLASFFVKRYSSNYEQLQNAEKIHKYLTSIPSKGTFDINNVLLSTYFFN